MKRHLHKYRFDALFIFGAVMRWDRANREWCFPPILEKEEYVGRLVLGEWRAKAAAVLHPLAPLVLFSGGSNKHPETGEQCSRAVELARHIVRHGVPSEKVVPMGANSASHTLGNVANLTDFLRLHPMREIGMVCPRFQMLRAMVMQYHDPFYLEHDIHLEWIEVERVLVETKVLAKAEIDAIYASSEADECWRMEQQGMKDFLTGSYEPKKSD